MSQRIENLEAIKLNTKFRLELIELDSSKYSYKVISTEIFNSELETSSARKLLDDSLKNNEIQGIFGFGKFGNTNSTLLLIKSGHEFPIDYSILIDTKGKEKYKKTSTIQLYPNIPSIEMWPHNIYSLKFVEFSKAEIKEYQLEQEKIDTICKSDYDIERGNILLNEQLTLILDLVSKQKAKGIARIKEYEDSIKSIPTSAWGWGDALNIIDSNNRLIGTYIKRRKIAEPLVFEITECPYLEREVAYFYTKKERNIKFVVFKWRQKWIEGWQSRDYYNIESDFRTKHEFIKKFLNKTLGLPSNILENKKGIKTEWATDEGVIAELYLHIDQYSRSLRLKIYLEDE
ncbi:hypothetical protein [Carboxylicivirga sp. RSCT41]|uniref:hypothetical protein n=1 Tax=Carboxylicivirga agarovorans TaxID=3417570 RepID=UPI003D324B5F